MIKHAIRKKNLMILIDALYVNNGGGKILLDYLISELLKNNTDNIYFLFDNLHF